MQMKAKLGGFWDPTPTSTKEGPIPCTVFQGKTKVFLHWT